MPIFVYEPAATHHRHTLFIGQRAVRADETFEAEGLGPYQEHMRRVPGRVVGGVQRPCIVQTGAAIGEPVAVPVVAQGDRTSVDPGLAAARRDMVAVLGVKDDTPDAYLLGYGAEVIKRLTGQVEALEARLLVPAAPAPTSEPDAPDAPINAYSRGALEAMSRTDLNTLCNALGVRPSSTQARSKAGVIEALAEAGFVDP